MEKKNCFCPDLPGPEGREQKGIVTSPGYYFGANQDKHLYSTYNAVCTVLSALSTLTSPTPQPREGDPTVILLILQMSKRRHRGFTTLPKAKQIVSGRHGIQNQAMWP